MSLIEIQVIFKGHVQGVGFRATLQRHAEHFQINGFARNLEDGSVEMVVQGEKEALNQLIQAIQDKPRAATISSLSSIESQPQALFNNFLII